MTSSAFPAPSEDMLNLARKAFDAAYAPYSNFQVGAAIKAANGDLFAGCNVENAAYPSGSCAEQGAISAMVVGGQTRIAEIVIMGGGDLITPCGACRQRLREFATEETLVHLCTPEKKCVQTLPFSSFLPMSFGPDHLSC